MFEFGILDNRQESKTRLLPRALIARSHTLVAKVCVLFKDYNSQMPLDFTGIEEP